MKILKRDEFVKLLKENPEGSFAFYVTSNLLQFTKGCLDSGEPFGAISLDREGLWDYGWSPNEYKENTSFIVLELEELAAIQSLVCKASLTAANIEKNKKI